MTSAPGWSFDLTSEVRTVLSWGLPGTTGSHRPALDDAGWHTFRAEVERHRLLGLLVAAVADEAIETSPDQAAEVARLEVDLTLVRMWQEARFPLVVADLEQAGIDVRVLKGPAFGALDYVDAQLRPTSDLDLLVRADDIDAAAARLETAGALRVDPDPTPGYAATVGKGATLALPDGLEVDLHRTLVWGPFGVRIRTEDLWERSRTFELAGNPVQAMDLESSLLHACYHLLVLGYRRALSLRDVAQMLLAPELDPDRVLRLARRWTGEAALAAGVLLAVDELGLTTDSILVGWAAGYAPRLRERLWMRVERPEAQIGPLEPLVTYQALRTPAERAVLRRATVQPVPGTWATPTERVERVRRRLAALAGSVRGG